MPIGLCIHVLHTAWASALLILGWKAYQSLICGMSDEFQDPALFCMLFLVLIL